MSSAGYLLAVDLGSSNTVAALRRPDGRSRSLLLDGEPILPSGGHLDREGRLHVGRDARRLALHDPERFEPAPKRRIDQPSVHLGDRDVTVVELLASILTVVARAAVEAVGFLPPTVLTYPATWDANRQQTLRLAAERAGFPPVSLVPEPVAAARYFTDVLRRPVPTGSCLAVVDFGGGTVDVAVLRRETAGFTVVSIGGAGDLGGQDVDNAIAGHVVAHYPAADQVVFFPSTHGQRREQRLFWDDVRGAKEMLARSATAPIGVPVVGAVLELSRADLHRLAAPLVERAAEVTAETLRRAGVQGSELAGLFLIGGSSRLSAVASALHWTLQVAPIVAEQPELPVAEGALAFAPTAASMVSPAASSTPDRTTSAEAVEADQPRSAGRRWRWWVAAAAAVVVLAVAGTAGAHAVRGWGAGASPVRPTPSASVGPNFVALRTIGRPYPVDAGTKPYPLFGTIDGDTGFLGWPVGTRLRVVSLDLLSGRQHWAATVPLARPEFIDLRSVGGNLLVSSRKKGGLAETVQVLDPSSGAIRWTTEVPALGHLFPGPGVIVVASEDGNDVRCLDARTGRERWRRTAPTGTPSTELKEVTPASELASAAGFGTVPESFDVNARTRLLELTPSSGLNVLDVATGKVTATIPGAGSSQDKFVTNGDQLYVGGGDSTAYQVRMFDLGHPKDLPVLLYQAPPDRTLRQLAPCLGGAVCLLDGTDALSNDAEVIAVSTAGRRELWRRAVPGTGQILPVGGDLLVYDPIYEQKGAAPRSRLFDAAGRQLLDAADRQRIAVRLSASGILLFSHPFHAKPVDETLTGVDAGTGQTVPLGEVPKTLNSECVWSATFLLCPNVADDGNYQFTIWQLAEG